MLFLFKSNKTKANLAAHALCQFSIRENHLISERERDRERETETETETEREGRADTGQRTETDRECLCLWQPKSVMAFIKPFEVPQEM